MRDVVGRVFYFEIHVYISVDFIGRKIFKKECVIILYGIVLSNIAYIVVKFMMKAPEVSLIETKVC